MIVEGKEYTLNNGDKGKAVDKGDGLFDIISKNNRLICSVDSNGVCNDTNDKDLNKSYSVKFDDYEMVIRDKQTGKVYSSVEEMMKGRKDERIEKELNDLLYDSDNNIKHFIEYLSSNEMKKEIMEYLNERVSR
jgi:accessory colonization factor AcfC